METIEKLLLLRYIIRTLPTAGDTSSKTSNVEEKNEIISKLNNCISVIENFNRANIVDDLDADVGKQPAILSEANEAMIQLTLTKSIDFLSEDQKTHLDPSNWDTMVPAPLHISRAPGVVNHGPGGWMFPPSRTFNVRGLDYLKNNEKFLSDSPLFLLRGVQMVKKTTLQLHVAKEHWCAYPKYKHNTEWLILNYMIPGAFNVQIVCLFSATEEAAAIIRESRSADGSPVKYSVGWKNALAKFWEGNPSYCDNTFKLIPSVVEGPWAVKYAVGNKPALTGKKLSQRYFKGEGYFEIDIDISSSSIAANILRLVRNASSSMVVDLGITIQGDTEEELPERILCQARYSNIDFNTAW